MPADTRQATGARAQSVRGDHHGAIVAWHVLEVSRRELMSYGGSAALAAAAGLGIGLPVAQAAASRFVFANESDYDTIDPHAAFDVGRVAVRLNIYDGLMRWQKNPAVLEPWVAESHTISADGLTYTFKLRKGVKFHDGTRGQGVRRRLLARAHPGARQGCGLAVQDHDRIPAAPRRSTTTRSSSSSRSRRRSSCRSCRRSTSSTRRW